MPSRDLIRISLDDRIWGIDGVYRGKEEADGFDDEEDLYYVKYSPPADQFQWLPSVIKSLFGKGNIEKTPEPIPESQIHPKTCSHAGRVPGVPRQKVVLTQTHNGDSYYENQREQELEDKLRHERQRSQKHRAQARKTQADQAREEMVDDDENRQPRRDDYRNEFERPVEDEVRR